MTVLMYRSPRRDRLEPARAAGAGRVVLRHPGIFITLAGEQDVSWNTEASGDER